MLPKNHANTSRWANSIDKFPGFPSVGGECPILSILVMRCLEFCLVLLLSTKNK